MHGGGHAWQGACVVGDAWQGDMHVPRQILRDTVNEQAVGILLECNLVKIFLEDISLFCGPLIPLFWTSGDV